jgi:rubrerythrin
MQSSIVHAKNELVKGEIKMLSKIPIKMENIKEEDIDREILRVAVIAELDAINLYEQMASIANNEDIKTLLLDIAREEKTHVGEFQSLLLQLDKEQVRELKKGEEEVKELLEG